MKKICIIALGLATALTAGAQMNVVKEAERAMKANEEAAKVLTIITPAFSDPETSNLAQTYYIPGKASFGEYDRLLGLKQFNKLKEGDDAKMGRLLIQGYDMFTKALPLDQVTDAKGKVKTKYTKDMISLLAGHFTDYSNAGADLFNAKDYDGAYEAWAIFNALPENPAVREKINGLPNDTIFGEIAFNQALAAWQANKLDKALDAFMLAKSKGYNKKQLYDYAIAVAVNAKNNDAVLALAQEALPLYGNEDDMYISQVVNYYLQNKQYDQAFDYINKAIATEPNRSQYYVIQGVLYENVDKGNEAKEAYKKAFELNAQNAQAAYNYGRRICEEAYNLNDQAPTTQSEYQAYYDQQIKPLFVQAADILETAYNLDNDNMDVLKYLENVYYNLHDEAKLKDVQDRMKY